MLKLNSSPNYFQCLGLGRSPLSYGSWCGSPRDSQSCRSTWLCFARCFLFPCLPSLPQGTAREALGPSRALGAALGTGDFLPKRLKREEASLHSFWTFSSPFLLNRCFSSVVQAIPDCSSTPMYQASVRSSKHLTICPIWGPTAPSNSRQLQSYI